MLHTLKRAYTGKMKPIYIYPPYNTGSDSFKGTRWRTVCLVLLLILGQAALLQHVVHHQLEHMLAQQDDDSGCSFCAIGGHMASNALPPKPMPYFIWARVVPLPSAQCITSHSPQTLGARGPPLLSVA